MLFNYLQFCLEQVVKDNELGALKQALDGAYVEPGGLFACNSRFQCILGCAGSWGQPLSEFPDAPGEAVLFYVTHVLLQNVD